MRASRATSAPTATRCRARTSSAGPTPGASHPRSCQGRTRATDMSLLLEALKKAEKAKEEALRRTKGGDAQAAEPRLQLEETPSTEKPVLTRAELPDIRQPLEILTEEIAPEPQLAPGADYAMEQGEGLRQ